MRTQTQASNLDYRQAIKDENLPAGAETATAQTVLGVVMDIWQLERGHMIEDQEVYDDLWNDAADLLTKHDTDAKNASDLVDRILADMPGSATFRDPAVSGRMLS
ncbi:MAG: hypothetical protein ACOZAM_15835 [Pseudomonadota bacterium]